MRSSPIVYSVLLACGVFTTNGESAPNTTNVVIDGYTVNSTLNSTATLPLETTVILVCRISGIPHGLQTDYHWTCPNGTCQQTGYAGRKINNNMIAINITSTSDGGTYTCTVTAEGREASQQFQLNVNGGQVVHSYGRLIFNERVITDKQQLQPPNNDRGDGRIECRLSSGEARFSYHGRPEPGGARGDVHQTMSGSTATVVIRDRAFNNFVNFEGNCAGIYFYLFLSNNTVPDVSIIGTTSTDTSVTVNIGDVASGIARVIIGYQRLDLGVPVVGEYGNNGMGSSRTFSSLVPGAKYRITAWGLSGGNDRRRSQLPAVREVTTMEQTPSPPRHLTITRVFDDGIELNWIPPEEPNGDIQHYIIKYTTQNGTQQEINTTNNINYYNLTGLERGQTYNNITVVAVNSAGSGGGSQPITSYVHNSTVESTKSTGIPTPSTSILSPTNSTPSLPTSTPYPPTSTLYPVTNTPSPLTNTLSPPTSTPSPPTSTPSPPTSTPSPPTSTPYPPTSTLSPTTNTPVTTTGTSSATSGKPTEGPTVPLLPAIAGVVAAAIIVLILMIVVIMFLVVLIKHKKKRAKNKSHTVQVYNDMDHYNAEEDTKPDTVYYSAGREPPEDGDRDDDSDEGIVEDKVGHSYDDVNKPTMKLQFDQETQEYDDIITQPRVKITGFGPISAGYEDVELVPLNTTANIKQTMKMRDTKLVGDVVYAVPDMSKKRRKKKVDEEQEMDFV